MSSTLTITNPKATKDTLSGTLCAALEDVAGIAELLRLELFARGVSTRRTVCQRTQEQLGAFVAIDKDVVRKTLDDLERVGDVLSAPGGRVAPAPLRLVELGGDRYAVFGGIPRAYLDRELSDVNLTLEGIQRRLSVNDLSREELAGKVDCIRGLVLSIERWAGLDRVSPCGESWLDQISSRLEFERVTHGSWDNESLEPWSVYVPDGSVPQQRRRWIRGHKKDAKGKLWRSRHVGGWWVYAWCESGSPELEESLKLRQDDAVRTAFSLDANTEAPLEFSWTEGNAIELEVDAFLPLAEFRFLNVTGNQKRLESGAYSYNFPLDSWKKVAAMLRKRLGIKLTRST